MKFSIFFLISLFFLLSSCNDDNTTSNSNEEGIKEISELPNDDVLKQYVQARFDLLKSITDLETVLMLVPKFEILSVEEQIFLAQAYGYDDYTSLEEMINKILAYEDQLEKSYLLSEKDEDILLPIVKDAIGKTDFTLLKSVKEIKQKNLSVTNYNRTIEDCRLFCKEHDCPCGSNYVECGSELLLSSFKNNTSQVQKVGLMLITPCYVSWLCCLAQNCGEYDTEDLLQRYCGE